MADQCERTAKAATDPAAQYVYRSLLLSGGSLKAFCIESILAQ